MVTRTVRLLRAQAVGVLALVLALGTGTAFAVAARNSVVSSSIKDGQVRRADLADEAVTRGRVAPDAVDGSKVRDDSLTGADVADGALTDADLADGSVGPDDVAGLTAADFVGTFTGADVLESTLSSVPTAAQAGTGRFDGTGSCDPESTVWVACATVVPVTLAAVGRVLVLARVTASTEADSDLMWGTCILEIDGVVQPPTQTTLREGDNGSGDNVRSTMALYLVTAPLTVGNHTVTVACRQENLGAVTFPAASVATVLLGPA